MANLPQEIGRLSSAEKFDLLDALWESLESDLPTVTPEQGEELDRREARYGEDPSAVLAWEQIKADLLRKR